MQKIVLFMIGVVIGIMLGVVIASVALEKRTADAQAAQVATNAPAIVSINQQLAGVNQQLAGVNQQLAASYLAYTELAKTAQATDVAQVTELSMLARTLSDYFGKEKWARMVNKSREGLIAELKQAQKAQQQKPK